MNLRIKNKKLKQRLGYVERENELLKEALHSAHNELCRKRGPNTRTLMARHASIAETRYADERFVEYMKEELVHMMIKGLAPHLTVNHHVDYSGLYPKDIYEGSITIVEPEPSYQREQLCRWVDEGKFDRERRK